MRSAVLLAVALAWCRSGASAQRTTDETTFWGEIRSPGRARARVLLEHALVRLAAQEREASRPYHRAAILAGAIERLERAHRLAPDAPDILLLLARSLTLYQEPSDDGTLRRRDDEALEALLALRRLDPGYAAETVGFELGLVYSRLGRLGDAAREYHYALDHSLSPQAHSVTQGYVFAETQAVTRANLAEVLMMDGRLSEAVVQYGEAVRLARRGSGGRALALALWGRAVCEDRLGEHDAALASAQAALGVGGGGMEVLRSDGVFFEPPSEIHYYEALGHQADAQTLEGRERVLALRRALRSWRRYLALATPDDPWRSLVVRHAEALDGALDEAVRQRR